MIQLDLEKVKFLDIFVFVKKMVWLGYMLVRDDILFIEMLVYYVFYERLLGLCWCSFDVFVKLV